MLVKKLDFAGEFQPITPGKFCKMNILAAEVINILWQFLQHAILSLKPCEDFWVTELALFAFVFCYNHAWMMGLNLICKYSENNSLITYWLNTACALLMQRFKRDWDDTEIQITRKMLGERVSWTLWFLFNLTSKLYCISLVIKHHNKPVLWINLTYNTTCCCLDFMVT